MIADLLLSDSLYFGLFEHGKGSCNTYWKAEPSWDLGVDMRIHIVQDFNDVLVGGAEVFLGEGWVGEDAYLQCCCTIAYNVTCDSIVINLYILTIL